MEPLRAGARPSSKVPLRIEIYLAGDSIEKVTSNFVSIELDWEQANDLGLRLLNLAARLRRENSPNRGSPR